MKKFLVLVVMVAMVMALGMTFVDIPDTDAAIILQSSREATDQIGNDGRSLINIHLMNAATFEGSVSDAIEATLIVEDCNGADCSITISNGLSGTGGNLAYTDSQLDANVVGYSQLKTSSVGANITNNTAYYVTITSGASSGTATVNSGGVVFGCTPFANVDNPARDIANKCSISGTTLTVTMINGSGVGASRVLVYEVQVMEAAGQ